MILSMPAFIPSLRISNNDNNSFVVVVVTSFLLGATTTALLLSSVASCYNNNNNNNYNHHHQSLLSSLLSSFKKKPLPPPLNNNNNKERSSSSSNDNNNNVQQQTTKIIDHPNLDLRILRKAEAVIQNRTEQVVLVIERCTNDHNYSAILRTAEALGIQYIYIIQPPSPITVLNDEDNDDNNDDCNHIDMHNKIVKQVTVADQQARNQHRVFAQNATEWITIKEFNTTTECIQYLRNNNFHIWVTDLSQKAISMNDELQNLIPELSTEKIAIVMGTEAVGCSKEVLEAADLRIYLPLVGFADSLNLSVATALIIQKFFFLYPNYVGLMSNTARTQLRQDWYPKLTKQRLLSSSEKKKYKILQKQIKSCEKIKITIEENNVNGIPHDPEQIEKFSKYNEYKKELNILESKFNNVNEAVAEYIDNPPTPLSDLRRADTHRITFAGKQTKRLLADEWKDIVATKTVQTSPYATAQFFRNLVFNKQQQK